MIRGEVIQATSAERDAIEAAKKIRVADLLPEDQRSQGAKALELFRGAIGSTRFSVVEVLDGTVTAALGTVVDGDGLVLTKASELPDGPRCRLADGRVVASQVVGVDPAYDLALLRVPARGLEPVAWAASANLPIGTLVAAAGPGPLPVKIGPVSLPLQVFSGPFATTIPRPPAKTVTPPAVLGSAVQGRGYWVEFVEGHAATAGIRSGDLLVSIAGIPIRSHEDVINCVEGRRVGDQLPVQVIRTGKTLNLMLTTEIDTSFRIPGTREVVQYSHNRAKPPMGIPVAVPVMANECGGPLVGLDGKVLGMIIGRPEVTFAYLLPADQVVARLKDLRQGHPLAAVPPGKIHLPPAPNPVTASAQDILQKLEERTNRVASLLVEYDLTTEADVDPRLLVAWQLGVGRDFREHHRVAFRGNKRLTDITSSKVFAFPAPALETSTDPAVPANVARRLEVARHIDTECRKSGRIDHLLQYGRSGIHTRHMFNSHYMFMAGWDQPVDAAYFVGPRDYLANIGLRPINPKPDDIVSEQAWRLPGNFARLPKCRVRPTEELVDGVGCVVLDVPIEPETETIWLDPTLGYSPRKWEVRMGDRLVWRRTNHNFREFGPNCWLPLEAAEAHGPPSWVAVDTQGQLAYTRRMVLRYARVNDVPDSIFTK